MELWQLDATELAREIRFGRVSSREAVRSSLARMDAVNGKLNAIPARFREDLALEAGEVIEAAEGVVQPIDPAW